ncbi:hypothetical protein [Oricola indica]|jgi:gas vesicle protein|uniref:hypothetical protein n=1 Tax=Oricola indica TaxID=2872591 RepID=UPI001CC06F62|nr:hypothetical protein [Oricola indica]
MNPEIVNLTSGFGGALLGALVGGFISWLLAKQSSAETLKRDREARDEEQKSYALRLMVKASLVLSDVVAIKNAINQSLSDANERGLSHLPFWRRVIPIVPSSKSYEVDASELVPLIAAKEADLVTAATEVFMQHATLIAAIDTYFEKRGEIKKLIKRHSGVRDGVVMSELTESEIAALAPYELELESIIKEVRSALGPLQANAEKVTFGIGPAIQKHYGDKGFPIFIADETKIGDKEGR